MENLNSNIGTTFTGKELHLPTMEETLEAKPKTQEQFPEQKPEDEKEVIPNVESKKWETVNSSTSGEFSAVAYFFAKL